MSSAVLGMHPVLACVETIDAALREVAGAEVGFLPMAEREAAMNRLVGLSSRLEGLGLRLMAASEDVAAEHGALDVAAHLAVVTRSERPAMRRRLRLARALDRRWHRLATAVGGGEVNVEQAHVIAAALDALPDRVGVEVKTLAEERLVAEAASFGPRELRTLGRRILDLVAPEVGEDEERRALDQEERNARRRTNLTTRRLGDGTTRISIIVPDAIASRFMTYLDAFASPRRHRHPAGRDNDGGAPGSDLGPDGERIPYSQRLGWAFCAFLEAADPKRLPLQGGDATTVVVTIDLASLRDGLGVAALGSEETITASEARRLACNAQIIPMVLGGDSQILDAGRARRFYRGASRKAMAVRDRVCRAQGCDIPAAWCEAHHYTDPWAAGGRSDLDDGRLLCQFHHHRAHDDRYLHTELPNGDIRFHRRR